MTNREYFKDPDDQCQMFLLERHWKDKYYHPFDKLVKKIRTELSVSVVMFAVTSQQYNVPACVA